MKENEKERTYIVFSGGVVLLSGLHCMIISPSSEPDKDLDITPGTVHCSRAAVSSSPPPVWFYLKKSGILNCV